MFKNIMKQNISLNNKLMKNHIRVMIVMKMMIMIIILKIKTMICVIQIKMDYNLKKVLLEH